MKDGRHAEAAGNIRQFAPVLMSCSRLWSPPVEEPISSHDSVCCGPETDQIRPRVLTQSPDPESWPRVLTQSPDPESWSSSELINSDRSSDQIFTLKLLRTEQTLVLPQILDLDPCLIMFQWISAAVSCFYINYKEMKLIRTLNRSVSIYKLFLLLK